MQRCAQAMLIAAMTLLAVGTGHVRAGTEETLGGGSDIRTGALVELTSGASLGPSHHVFADNPGTTPIDVEFRAEAAPGITITPELDRFTLQPGTSLKDPFTLALDPALPPGDYPVTVLLVRADITSEPGSVTNVPAVGTSFTIRVVGASGTVTVEARSLESSLPVVGTLVLAALSGSESAFEIGRAEDDNLTQTVAPGRYRASFILDGRELGSQEATIADGQTVTIRLDVNTVSFVIVDAQPVNEDGRVVVADLTASLNNHLYPIDGSITIRALVYRDDQHIDTATLHDSTQLAIGVTEANLTYRPQQGFAPGEYRFEYELITDDFTLRSTTEPTFTAQERPATRTVIYIAAASTAALTALILGTLFTRRRRRRRPRPRPPGTALPPPEAGTSITSS